MINALKWIFSAICLAAALQKYFVGNSLFLWKGSIVTTEYGHWLAILPLIALFVCLIRRGPFDPQRLLRIAIYVISFAGLMLPTLEMIAHRSLWESSLKAAFGAPKREIPQHSLLELYSIRGGPAAGVQTRTVSYWKEKDDDLSLDVYAPEDAKNIPWVMVVHGGGWDSGDRKQLDDLNYVLASEGYGVVSIDYHLAPSYTWPAPLKDVEHAASYVKTYGAQWGFAPDRWVILGRSAGAQIAEAFAYEVRDTTLKGCIAFYGPSDIEFAYDRSREDDMLKSRQLMRAYFGGVPTDHAQAYHEGSPLAFVNHDSPPTLLFHGQRDPIVWNLHSHRLQKVLTENDVPNVFIELPWGTHGFDFNLHGPGGITSTHAVEFFLATTLFLPIEPAHK